MVQCFPWFTRMSAGTWEPFSWGSLGFPPRGPGSRAGFGSHPGQGVSSSPLLLAPRQGRPRGSGAHLGQQDAPSSVSPDTSPAGISDPIAAGDDGAAPGRSARAPEGLTRAGRSRPARDRAAPSAAAAPAEGGEGSAARRGWQQDGAGGEGAEELRVAEWVTVGAPSSAPRPGPSAADVPAPPSPVCGVGGARRGGVRGRSCGSRAACRSWGGRAGLGSGPAAPWAAGVRRRLCGQLRRLWVVVCASLTGGDSARCWEVAAPACGVRSESAAKRRFAFFPR